MIKGKAYINGKFVASSKTINIVGARQLKVIGTVPSLTIEEIDFAYKSAKKSFQTWSQTKIKKRILLINKFAKLLDKNKNILAKIMFDEIAKPLEQGISEIKRSLEYIEQTIVSFNQIYFQKIKINQKTNYCYRLPLGVVLAISPFNYPINLSLSKIIPALLSGNSVVFKPATNGSLVASEMIKFFDQAKFPPGVINLVTGRGKEIGDILTKNPQIAMISFTGGIEVGQNIARKNPLIPIVLELGGNDGAYVRDDANLIKSAIQIAKGAFDFGGQRCTAIKRLIVHQKIKDQFLPLLINQTKQLEKIPLVTQEAANYVQRLLNEKENKILLGGKKQNNIFENTIVQTTKTTKTWTKEAFGPLLPIIYVKSDQEALALINETNYGLQNSLFTKNIKWAHKTALTIESGSVNINGASSRGPDQFPFLGLKDSGFGVQGIKEALLSMTRYHNVVENE